MYLSTILLSAALLISLKVAGLMPSAFATKCESFFLGKSKYPSAAAFATTSDCLLVRPTSLGRRAHLRR